MKRVVRWLEWLEAMQVWARALALSTLFVAKVVADAATGLDFTLRALYLLPVGAAAWLLGRRAGFS